MDCLGTKFFGIQIFWGANFLKKLSLFDPCSLLGLSSLPGLSNHLAHPFYTNLKMYHIALLQPNSEPPPVFAEYSKLIYKKTLSKCQHLSIPHLSHLSKSTKENLFPTTKKTSSSKHETFPSPNLLQGILGHPGTGKDFFRLTNGSLQAGGSLGGFPHPGA